MGNLHERKIECRKNPGHTDFISAKNFDTQHLPKTYRNSLFLKLVGHLATLTVYVKVKRISKDRPKTYEDSTLPFPFYKLRGTQCGLYGTGWISDVHIHECECGCQECQDFPHHEPPYATITITTAAHVMYDNYEAERSTCYLFYEDGDIQKAKPLGGFKFVPSYGDITDHNTMYCHTHNMELARKLKESMDQYEAVNKEIHENYSPKVFDPKNTLIVIVSHPHGCNKQVSIGTWIRHVRLWEYDGGEDFSCSHGLYGTFVYNATTCPGSSGAHVWILGGYDKLGNWCHISGTDHTARNRGASASIRGRWTVKDEAKVHGVKHQIYAENLWWFLTLRLDHNQRWYKNLVCTTENLEDILEIVKAWDKDIQSERELLTRLRTWEIKAPYRKPCERLASAMRKRLLQRNKQLLDSLGQLMKARDSGTITDLAARVLLSLFMVFDEDLDGKLDPDSLEFLLKVLPSRQILTEEDHKTVTLKLLGNKEHMSLIVYTDMMLKCENWHWQGLSAREYTERSESSKNLLKDIQFSYPWTPLSRIPKDVYSEAGIGNDTESLELTDQSADPDVSKSKTDENNQCQTKAAGEKDQCGKNKDQKSGTNRESIFDRKWKDELEFGSYQNMRDSFNNCKKNPGHKDFIPVEEFRLDHLPVKYQVEEFSQLVKFQAYRTVCLSVERISDQRPETYKGRKLPFPRDMIHSVGTGWISEIEICEDRYNWKECQESPNTVKQYARVTVQTASHLVYDQFEAENTICDVSFHDKEKDEKVQLKGFRASPLSSDGTDFSLLCCQTDNMELASRLKDSVDNFEAISAKIQQNYNFDPDDTLILIVSHPHGQSKRVSIGTFIRHIRLWEFDEAEDSSCFHGLYGAFIYNAATCPASSGAHVWVLGGYDKFRKWCHSDETDEQGFNRGSLTDTIVDYFNEMNKTKVDGRNHQHYTALCEEITFFRHKYLACAENLEDMLKAAKKWDDKINSDCRFRVPQEEPSHRESFKDQLVQQSKDLLKTLELLKEKRDSGAITDLVAQVIVLFFMYFEKDLDGKLDRASLTFLRMALVSRHILEKEDLAQTYSVLQCKLDDWDKKRYLIGQISLHDYTCLVLKDENGPWQRISKRKDAETSKWLKSFLTDMCFSYHWAGFSATVAHMTVSTLPTLIDENGKEVIEDP